MCWLRAHRCRFWPYMHLSHPDNFSLYLLRSLLDFESRMKNFFNSPRLSPRHSRWTRDMHSFVLIMHTHKSNPLHSITSAHSRVSSSSSSSAFWLRHSRNNIHELLLFVFLCSQNIWSSSSESAGYKLSSPLFASSRSLEKRRFDDWNRYAMIIGFLFPMLRIFRGILIPCLRRSKHKKDCITGLSC